MWQCIFLSANRVFTPLRASIREDRLSHTGPNSCGTEAALIPTVSKVKRISKETFLMRELETLHVNQFLVVTVQSNQFVVLASFNDDTLMHYTDFIGIFDGAQTVSNGNGGAG